MYFLIPHQALFAMGILNLLGSASVDVILILIAEGYCCYFPRNKVTVPCLSSSVQVRS